MGELKGNVSLRAAAREVSIHTKILFHFSFFMLWRAVLSAVAIDLPCLHSSFSLVCTEGGVGRANIFEPLPSKSLHYTTGGNKVRGLRDCSKPFDHDLSDKRIYIIDLLRLLFCLINLSMDKPNISQYINSVAYYVDLYLPRFKIYMDTVPPHMTT